MRTTNNNNNNNGRFGINLNIIFKLIYIISRFWIFLCSFKKTTTNNSTYSYYRLNQRFIHFGPELEIFRCLILKKYLRIKKQNPDISLAKCGVIINRFLINNENYITTIHSHDYTYFDFILEFIEKYESNKKFMNKLNYAYSKNKIEILNLDKDISSIILKFMI